MAAVARKNTPKSKQRSVSTKPMARQPAASKAAPTPVKAPVNLKGAKGRAAPKNRAIEESEALPVKAPSKTKTTTKPLSKATATAKTKAQKVKTQEAKAALVCAPPSRTKAPDLIVKPRRKSRKRKRRSSGKGKVELTTVTVPASKKPAPERNKVTAANIRQVVAPARVAAKGATKSNAKDAVVTVKAKRVRAPKDLAAQYGEGETKTTKRRAGESAETKRARRDAVLRQKMRDAMEVGDDLIARLQRAGMIAGGDEPESKNGHNGHSARRIVGSRVFRRPRKWEARCGKCGNKSLFKTQAGLCAKCGAIMVRES